MTLRATAVAALFAFAAAAFAAPNRADVPEQSTTGPIPPPGVLSKDRHALPPGARSVVIPDVPAYLWRHGCGPTAIGMVLGYHDTHGFDALMPGDASTQTEEVDQAIASERNAGDPGHYEDYSLPLDDAGTGLLADKSEAPPGDEHPNDCVADFLRTSWSALANYYGWSWSFDVEYAFEAYASLANPDFDSDAAMYSVSDGTLTWARLTTEIDNERPMVFLVDTDGDGGTDHFVTVVGYSETPAEQYGCLDTWPPAGTVRWCDFLPMAGGRPWGVSRGWTFDPDTTVLVDAAGGGNYLAIQDGIDAAVDGGRVLVMPGTYAGSRNRDLDPHGKSLNISSQAGPEETVIDCEGAGRGFNFHTGENAACVVGGFTIRNGSSSAGAGVRCFVGASPVLANLVIKDCVSAGNGGGITCGTSAAPSISRVAIVGCSAAGNGGGISCASSSPSITNVTVYGCSAGTYGGGIACTGATARPTIEKSIIAGSAPGAGLACDSGASPTTTRSCSYGNAGGDLLCGTYYDNLADDPLFCDAGAHDFTLRAGSPCLPEGNPWGVTMGAYGVGSCPSGVPDESWATAAAVLHPARPNPFGSGTLLAFDLAGGGEVEIRIHDAAGRVVRTLAPGSRLGAGPHTVAWDGRDDEGRDVASGVYFCSVRLCRERVTGKLVVVR